MSGVELTGSAGTVTASAGDTFNWYDGTSWQIVSFPGDAIYSPSGLGGCPTVLCRHLAGDLPPYWQQYMEDGCTEWCGDSVAYALIRTRGTPTHLIGASDHDK